MKKLVDYSCIGLLLAILYFVASKAMDGLEPRGGAIRDDSMTGLVVVGLSVIAMLGVLISRMGRDWGEEKMKEHLAAARISIREEGTVAWFNLGGGAIATIVSDSEIMLTWQWKGAERSVVVNLETDGFPAREEKKERVKHLSQPVPGTCWREGETD